MAAGVDAGRGENCMVFPKIRGPFKGGGYRGYIGFRVSQN